jgi:hypothetical protein
VEASDNCTRAISSPPPFCQDGNGFRVPLAAHFPSCSSILTCSMSLNSHKPPATSPESLQRPGNVVRTWSCLVPRADGSTWIESCFSQSSFLVPSLLSIPLILSLFPLAFYFLRAVTFTISFNRLPHVFPLQVRTPQNFTCGAVGILGEHSSDTASFSSDFRAVKVFIFVYTSTLCFSTGVNSYVPCYTLYITTRCVIPPAWQ